MKGKIALATLAIMPMTANNAYALNIGIVTASSLNVRSGPSTSYTIVTTVKKNDKVNILQSSNGWYKIETASGKQGWASSSYISISDSNTNNNINTSSNIAIVNTDGLNFRNGAGTSYSIIKVLNKGEKVEVISESNGWSKVKHDSRLGYVASQYIDKTTTNYIIKEVNTDGLNVRTGPSTSYASIGKLNTGDKVEVISESAGWSKINYNNKTAYVSSGYLKAASTTTPSTTEQYKEIKVVNTDGLNVRKGPSTSYESIGKIDKGTNVEVISESNGWSKINYKNTTAYVATKYLDKKSTDTEDTTEQYKEIKVVNTDGLNVRKGPSISYESIGKIDKGTNVEVISESNGWSKINYKNTTAYVATKYLDKKSTDTEDTTEQYKEIKVVNTDGLNVRKGPSTSYESIGKIDKGTNVEVISESNGWSKINYKNTTAYVATKYLDKKSTDTEDTTEQYKEIKVVNTDGLNVRKGPSTSYESIGKIDKGTNVEVISESNGWSKINYKNTTAYVATKYLDKISSNEQVPPVVGGDSVENVNGAAINYKGLNYTLQDHVEVQYKKALEGGNVISSSLSRSSEDLTTYNMAQSRAYVHASKSDLEYYLNPNNFTNSDRGMMQFLRLDTYKGGVSESELNSYLNSLPQVNGKNTVFYNQGKAFINAAQKYDIDLIYLVSHAMWETGYGKSVLSQGQTITSYKGTPLSAPVTVYNFYGIGAIDKSANVSGAEAAYSNGWTSIEATIDGSAKWIRDNYIKSSKYNQNTIYKMKFNYDYSFHQYATDVNWANGISGIMYKLISMYDTSSNLSFEVPNYK
ncbi:Beta-N-acetylglucosamidase [Romboutsia ilealis]|uniref:Beta-N-acetylglucosamidase n=4 Tax=Romboutsia ilealis TaxID=1115758 RepID=A0A1V1I4L7_9FIRM|nr:SH3 domain-containing protein [Romboutsia ilealis]CED94424.1 Beta-N-acetylglucosamidase [Romboutsia ilealis]